jgi:hypothetical protein
MLFQSPEAMRDLVKIDCSLEILASSIPVWFFSVLSIWNFLVTQPTKRFRGVFDLDFCIPAHILRLERLMLWIFQIFFSNSQNSPPISSTLLTSLPFLFKRGFSLNPSRNKRSFFKFFDSIPQFDARLEKKKH